MGSTIAANAFGMQVLKNSVQAGIGDDGVAFASGDVRVAAQSRAQAALAGLAFGCQFFRYKEQG